MKSLLGAPQGHSSILSPHHARWQQGSPGSRWLSIVPRALPGATTMPNLTSEEPQKGPSILLEKPQSLLRAVLAS